MAINKTFNHTNNDWSSTANWNPIPANGENILIPAGAQTAIINGMNQAAVDIASLETDEACGTAVGASGGPLIIGITRLHHRGFGNFYWQDDGATSNHIVIDPAFNNLNPTPTIEIGGAAITDVELVCFHGNITVLGSTGALGQLRVRKRRSTFDANVTLASNANAVTYTEMNAGKVTSFRPMTEVLMDAGTLIQESGVITSLEQGGGTCELKATGTYPKIILKGTAFLDLMTSPGAKVITEIQLYDQSRIRYMPGNTVHQITTFRDYRAQL